MNRVHTKSTENRARTTKMALCNKNRGKTIVEIICEDTGKERKGYLCIYIIVIDSIRGEDTHAKN